MSSSRELSQSVTDGQGALPLPTLTPRQLRWLAFHAAEPHPTHWQWRNKAGSSFLSGPPETWRVLWAAKYEKDVFGRRVRRLTRTIRAEDRAALEPYMDAFVVNAEGLSLLAALGDGAGHGTASTLGDSGRPA